MKSAAGKCIPSLKRILIIDDEPFNVIGMQLLLNNLGIKGLGSSVDRAYNGLEGFNKVKHSFMEGKHIYGLIITDISMPVMDGYQASKEIRDFYKCNQVPQPMIIACTGHVEEEYIKKAWMHQIDEVLPKPIKIEVLRDIFENIVEQQSSNN